MIVLAFDLGRHAGVAYGDAGGLVRLEQIDLPQDLGPMMSGFEGAVRGLIRKTEPDFMFWERPFVTTNKHDAQGEIRTQRLYGQAAACAKIAHEYGIRNDSERPMTIRKAVIGRGNAKEEEIFAFCRRCGVDAVTAHRADAYVAWLYAAKKLRR